MNSRLNTKCLRNFHFFVLFPFEELKPLKVKNKKFVRLFAAILHIVCVNLKLWLPQVNKNAKKNNKKTMVLLKLSGELIYVIVS